MIETKEVRSKYSLKERVFYQSKKLIFFVVLLSILVFIFGPSPLYFGGLVAKQVFKATIGVLLAGLMFHFGAPKIPLQTQLLNDNLSVAIVFAAIVLGVCLA